MNNPEAFQRRERAKARALRKTAWWQAQLQRGVCHYCGRHVGAAQLTMDHIVPVARGGTSTRGNCVPCCKACNTEKRTAIPVEELIDRLFPSSDGGLAQAEHGAMG